MKEKLIDTYNFENKEFLISFLNNNLHLSYSYLKEILEFFYELTTIKQINLIDFLENISFSSKNKKENTKYFIEYIREYRNPTIYNSLKTLKKTLNNIEKRQIKTIYPQYLEGDYLKLEITFTNEKDIEKTIKILSENINNLKSALNIIKKGG
ncbi:hypothetical protein EV215_1064 [Hypnocyclicus thermotrophus]|uniref:Uncharacterized protein n=1 Tax=Hypnocyclicus thermotrophus TaxID=1627895 RepID=A0AA46DYK3_9FUSO|nr:hypothetical protein [Hypnocyclicus thermotrophus]TDT70519.1 hypothetical protein EV215_1064 [Hypnocyclicus thermotrophus]